MKAIKAELFKCSKCQALHRTEDHAEQCCVCKKCGKEMKNQGWCEPCQNIARFDRERERFNRAKKVHWKQYDGMILSDETAYCAEDVIDLEDESKWSWATKKTSFQLDLDNAIENEAEGMWEDITDNLIGMDELRAAVDTFNKANIETCSYEETYDTAVILCGETLEQGLAMIEGETEEKK